MLFLFLIRTKLIMHVSSNHVPLNYQITQQNFSTIKQWNKTLLIIESEFNTFPEPTLTRKTELNDQLIGILNQIENKLRIDNTIDLKYTKYLQILKIKYGIVAIKSGDTTWEDFNLSTEIYKNNEKFFDSTNCLLSFNEQRQQGITKKEREFSWYCCLYNFAYQLIHHDVGEPADRNQQLFMPYFNSLKIEPTPNDVAIAIANARAAQKLCNISFPLETSPRKENLLNIVNKLNHFYDNYLKCETPNSNTELRYDAYILSSNLSVFLPDVIKKNLGINE